MNKNNFLYFYAIKIVQKGKCNVVLIVQLNSSEKKVARNYWIMLIGKILENFSLLEKQFLFLFWDQNPFENLMKHTLEKRICSSTHQILYIISGNSLTPFRVSRSLLRNTCPRISSECFQQVFWSNHISWYVGQTAKVSGLTWASWVGQ